MLSSHKVMTSVCFTFKTLCMLGFDRAFMAPTPSNKLIIYFILEWKRNSTDEAVSVYLCRLHDNVIKWNHFPRYWPFVRGIHRWPVNSPHKDQWRGALMSALRCAWADGWANNRDTGDLGRRRAHHDDIVMTRIGIAIIKMRRCHDRLIS